MQETQTGTGVGSPSAGSNGYIYAPEKGNVSQTIDLVNYDLPAVCDKCNLPLACSGGGSHMERKKKIWWRAETGNRCCGCDDPTPVNRGNVYLGWMPVYEVRELLQMERERIREELTQVLGI